MNWWEVVDDPSPLMRSVSRDDDPETALGAICLALHCIGKSVLRKSLSEPMAYEHFDNLLERISEHPAIPVMLVAFDEVSDTPGYGASRLAELKYSADDGARRIISKFRALGAPVQYGIEIAGNVYGIPSLTAMRYASRLENDKRAEYGPVAKSLGMGEVLNWAMMTSQAEKTVISKNIVEDDFFIRRGGKQKQMKVKRDSSTGRFASQGAGEDEENDFFSRIERRKIAPILERGAEEVATPPQTEERLRPKEREAVQELTAEEREAAEQQEYRQKQLARYKKLQSYRGAVKEGRRVAEAKANEWLQNEAEQTAARKRAKEMLGEQITARNERNLNRALEVTEAARMAEQTQSRTKDLVKYTTASMFAPDAVKTYLPNEPKHSSVEVSFSDLAYLQGTKVRAPMLASFNLDKIEGTVVGGGKPSEVALAQLYSGRNGNDIRFADREGTQEDIQGDIEDVNAMAEVFDSMHKIMASGRSKTQWWSANPERILHSMSLTDPKSDKAAAARALEDVFSALPASAWDYAMKPIQEQHRSPYIEDLSPIFNKEDMIQEWYAKEISNQIKEEIDRTVAQLEGREVDEDTGIDFSSFVNERVYTVSVAEALACAKDIEDTSIGTTPESDKAARAYAIYGTAWSEDAQTDDLVFLPTFQVESTIEMTGTDYNGEQQYVSLTVSSANQQSQRQHIADAINNAFRGGYMDEIKVSHEVQQTGFSNNVASANDKKTPPKKDIFLSGSNTVIDPNGAIALLNHLGWGLMLPVAFTDSMKNAYPELADKLLEQGLEDRAADQIKTVNQLREKSYADLINLKRQYPEGAPWDENP